MKTILKTSLLMTTAVATLSASAPAALLFQEDWSDLETGESAVSSGRWSITQGLPTQFIKSEPPTLAGNWIAPVYSSASGASVLPQIQTIESFSLGAEGIDFTVNTAFTNNSSQYFRIGLVSSDNALHNYWFTIHRNEVQLHKRNGSATPIKLADYTFNTGEWVLNEPKAFSLQVLPGEGSNHLSILLDGVSVISYTDSAGLPNFTNGFHLFVATRENQQGYIGNVTLQSIPEGGSTALLIGGLLLVGTFMRRQKATS